ncbi:MAG: Transcriptional regulatory protein CpxR [Steroidobacteraceae bacterium]|nr:Transcriptional regulatory protein CpxR [Steroidobacteraceae bacterium]
MTAQPPPRILLVDDDASLATLLGEILQLHGFEVATAGSGEAALARIDTDPPDLVVLDVMLPAINGFEVLARLRQRSELPVIMLTARGTDSERIAGLTGGADDYLAKPFNPLELLARIRAILKRAPARVAEAAPGELTTGTLRLDLRRFELHAGGRLVALTPAELRVVEVLMRRQGEVLSRAELTDYALQRPLEPYDRSIDTIMSKLRRKFAEARVDNPRIRGVRGHGYVLDEGGEQA